MKKLISILLAAALCAVLCVPALAEAPMDASAVLFGNGFPIVANTSNEELDEKASEDEASDDENRIWVWRDQHDNRRRKFINRKAYDPTRI